MYPGSITLDAHFDDAFENDNYSNNDDRENPFVSLMASVKPETDLSFSEDDL